MNIKDYLKRNGMTLILLVGMIILYLCIPSQIAENMAKERGVDLNQIARQMGVTLPK